MVSFLLPVYVASPRKEAINKSMFSPVFTWC